MAFKKMGCPPRIPPSKWHLLDVSWRVLSLKILEYWVMDIIINEIVIVIDSWSCLWAAYDSVMASRGWPLEFRGSIFQNLGWEVVSMLPPYYFLYPANLLQRLHKYHDKG
jgi:hypothetical protein